MAKRRIKNNSVILLFVLSCFCMVSFEKGWAADGIYDALISFLIYFFIFLFFYFLGWMGAGDVKLGAVVAFLFGLNDFFLVWVFSVFFALMYSCLESLTYFLGWESVREKLKSNDIGKKYVPYGACLGISSILMILKSEAGV